MLNDMLLGTAGVLLRAQAQAEPVEETNEVWAGWGSVIFVLTIITIVALVAALLIWQLFRTKQTQMMTQARVAEANAYRTLAEDATAAQDRTAGELALLREGVTDLRSRVTSIERILSEVG